MSGDEISLRVRRTLRDRRDQARFGRSGPEGVAGPPPDPTPWLEGLADAPWPATTEELAGRAANCPEPWILRVRAGADEILAGRFRWLGAVHELGVRPRWRHDVVSGVGFPAHYWAALPRSSPDGAFDYKHLWEPNIHESFVSLAKAHLLTGNEAYRDRLDLLWRDWMEQNPPLCGPNYLAPVEIGLRLLHWATAVRFRTAREPWPTSFLTAIWDHVHYQRYVIADNLSRGSSANNHLLGELASLVITDRAFPGMAPPDATQHYERELWDQIRLQFAPDGGNREQAFHYHAFSLTFALLARHAARRSAQDPPADVTDRLQAAVGFLRDGLDAQGRPFLYGDSDESEVLPLVEGARDLYAPVLALGDALLGGASPPDERVFWLTGERGDPQAGGSPEPKRRYPETGHVFLRQDRMEAHFNGGELGYLSIAAHAHADALAVELRHDGQDIVVDPGTGTYRGGSAWREALVSAEAHATTSPLSVEPAERRGPFLWGRRYPTALDPASQLEPGRVSGTLEFPGGATVQRELTLTPEGARIEDRWSGPPSVPVRLTWPLGPGTVEPAPDGAVLRGPGFTARFTVTGLETPPEVRMGDPSRPETPCRSPGYDVLVPGAALVWIAPLRLPATVVTSIAVRREG